WIAHHEWAIGAAGVRDILAGGHVERTSALQGNDAGSFPPARDGIQPSGRGTQPAASSAKRQFIDNAADVSEPGVERGGSPFRAKIPWILRRGARRCGGAQVQRLGVSEARKERQAIGVTPLQPDRE